MITLLHDFLCYFYAILFAIPTLALILQYNYLEIDIINDQLLRKLDHFLFKESSLFVVIAIYCFSSIFSSTRVTKSVNWGHFSSCTLSM